MWAGIESIVTLAGPPMAALKDGISVQLSDTMLIGGGGEALQTKA